MSPTRVSPGVAVVAKVAGFAALLVLTFVGAWTVGNQVEPVGAGPSPAEPSSTPAGDGHVGTGDTHE